MPSYTIQAAGRGAFIRPVEHCDSARAAIDRANTLARHNLAEFRAGRESGMAFGVYETETGRLIYTVEETPYYCQVTGGIPYV